MKKIRVKEVFLVLLLSAFCLNVFGMGVHLPIVLFPILLVYVIRTRFNLTFLRVLFILVSFSLVYTTFLYFYGYVGMSTILWKLCYPVFFYILGDKIVRGDVGVYKKTYRYLYVVIGSLTLYGFLNVFYTFMTFGSMENARISIGRTVLDIWGGGAMSATGLNSFLSLGASVLYAALIPVKRTGLGIKSKVFLLICFSLSLYGIIQLSNRTGIVIVFASLLMCFIYSKRMSLKKVRDLIYAGIVFLILSALYNANVFGIKMSWESTFLYNRFMESDFNDDPRILTWTLALKGLFENPLGGKETSIPLAYAHNIWLDVGFEAGIIPVVLLLVFSILSLLSLVQFIKYEHPILMKSLVIGLYTAFYITFFVEPIMQHFASYFTIFCLFLGIVQRLNFEFYIDKRKDFQTK